MRNPPDRARPGGPDSPGPVEPGTPLYRLLEMVAGAVARARAGAPPEEAGRTVAAAPPAEAPGGEVAPAPGPEAGPPP